MKTILTALTMLTIALPAMAQRPPEPNPFSIRLAKLDPKRRNTVLRNAIRDNGQWCDAVGDSRLQGPWRNLTMWTARCGRGADYGVFIGLDQSVQIRRCDELARLKLPTCILPPRRG